MFYLKGCRKNVGDVRPVFLVPFRLEIDVAKVLGRVLAWSEEEQQNHAGSRNSVTRKLNKISPSFCKKWPKIAKYLHKSRIWKPETSASNYCWNLKISTTNHELKLLAWVKMCWVKSSLKQPKWLNFAQSGHTVQELYTQTFIFFITYPMDPKNSMY